MDFVKFKFEQYKSIQGDIEEHLDLLYDYAKKCNSITEIGVRYFTSTFSFLLAKPEKMTCIDIVHPSSYGQEGANNLIMSSQWAKENGIIFSFILANDLEISIDECDLLFIDTDHTYEQLSKELNLHGDRAKKFLIFHDTNVESMTVAIYEFLQDHPFTWRILEKKDNCNGLMVLGRIA